MGLENFLAEKGHCPGGHLKTCLYDNICHVVFLKSEEYVSLRQKSVGNKSLSCSSQNSQKTRLNAISNFILVNLGHFKIKFYFYQILPVGLIV